MNAYPVEKMAAIAIALSSEKDTDKLLSMILDEAMSYVNCDGGTVYTLDDGVLMYRQMVTLSLDVRVAAGEGELRLPPIKLDRTHVCACAAMDKRRIKIDDIYNTDEYDFTGARNFDSSNGYTTRSMLVVPMEDEYGDIIGILQLINALDENGVPTVFPDSCMEIVTALASLAAVSLNNKRLSESIYDLLHSFVHVMVGAIDMRSPYNANHTKKMVKYAERFLNWLRDTDNPMKIEKRDEDPFIMSVWLHDIGKLIVPLEVLDKRTRLGNLEQGLMNRIDIAILCEEIRGLRNPEEEEDAELKKRELELARSLILTSNEVGFLDGERIIALRALERITCLTPEGGSIPLLTPAEMEAITIPKGTLTKGERESIERHALYTGRMLREMSFERGYRNVPEWAGSHHELLDGSGYPEGKGGDSLPMQVRLLTIIDIYDALTAEDRPYKPPMPPEAAFGVLESMRDAGKIDGDILAAFRESGAWKG